MNTTTLLAKALAEKFENTHFEDEYAIIMEMFKVLHTELGFDYKTARFILNEEDFVPDTLDELFSNWSKCLILLEKRIEKSCRLY